MNSKKEFMDAAINNTGALLQRLYHSNQGEETITSLLFRWNTNQSDNAYGVVAFSDYTLERNRVFKALQGWINNMHEHEGPLQALNLPELPLQNTYRILSISRNKEEERKMKELFGQFPEFDVATCRSDEIPDTTPFSIIIFDNFKLGPVTSATHKKLSTEDKNHLGKMAKWVDQQSQEALSKLAPPGFIIHYGKYCYLLDGYSNCAAANFPFTLYGLVKQIIEFWEKQTIPPVANMNLFIKKKQL